MNVHVLFPDCAITEGKGCGAVPATPLVDEFITSVEDCVVACAGKLAAQLVSPTCSCFDNCPVVNAQPMAKLVLLDSCQA